MKYKIRKCVKRFRDNVICSLCCNWRFDDLTDLIKSNLFFLNIYVTTIHRNSLNLNKIQKYKVI